MGLFTYPVNSSGVVYDNSLGIVHRCFQLTTSTGDLPRSSTTIAFSAGVLGAAGEYHDEASAEDRGYGGAEGRVVEAGVGFVACVLSVGFRVGPFS